MPPVWPASEVMSHSSGMGDAASIGTSPDDEDYRFQLQGLRVRIRAVAPRCRKGVRLGYERRVIVHAVVSSERAHEISMAMF